MEAMPQHPGFAQWTNRGTKAGEVSSNNQESAGKELIPIRLIDHHLSNNCPHLGAFWKNQMIIHHQAECSR